MNNYNVSGNDAREPFEAPVGKKERKTRERVVKERLHIYVSNVCIKRVDEKAEELGLDRSPCIQMLLNYALNNLQTIPSSPLDLKHKQPSSTGSRPGK